MFVKNSEWLMENTKMSQKIDNLYCKINTLEFLVRDHRLKEHEDIKETWEKPGHQVAEDKALDAQQKIVLFDMGLTGHEDLGVVMIKEKCRCGYVEYYRDKVHCGPISKVIDVPVYEIKGKPGPALARWKNLEKEVKLWLEELKEYYKPKPRTGTEIRNWKRLSKEGNKYGKAYDKALTARDIAMRMAEIAIHPPLHIPSDKKISILRCVEEYIKHNGWNEQVEKIKNIILEETR